MSRRQVVCRTVAAPLLVHASSPVDSGADRELLRLCAVIGSLDGNGAEGDRHWDTAMNRIAGLRPISAPGLQAKVRLALSMMPFRLGTPCPDRASPDERLFWCLLHDVLALSGDQTA